MNFDWMKEHDKLKMLFDSCREAEEFVLVRPEISAVAARRAMESIVKSIYQELPNSFSYADTVYEIVSDSAFRLHVNDEEIINAIHIVRKVGNNAAHNGNVSENDAMRSLEALCKLTIWYGIRQGMLQKQLLFDPPKPDRIQDIMQNIPFENFALRIEPYINLNGDISWLSDLKRADVVRLVNLPESPESVRTESFYRFLEQFEQSKKLYVEQIVELLPLTPATEQEWERRRESVSTSMTGEVDAFVNAMSDDTKGGYTIWRRYADLLDEKAGWYLQLVHPDIIPSTMRSGFVLPDLQTDIDSYIPLDEAVEQLLREIASGNEKKARLMCNRNWCREYLGLDFPVLVPKSNNLTQEERQKYSKTALHVGNKKFFHFLNWDKNSLFAIRMKAGELGERLVTLDRLADWGFSDPDSPAAQRARERARLRDEEEAARQEEVRRRELDTQRLLQNMNPLVEEVSPNEIRATIEKMPDYQKNVSLLTSQEWCEIHIGIGEPVLYPSMEWMRLRKKQVAAGKPLSYSGCVVEIGRFTYAVRRMNKGEYEVFLSALNALRG